MNWFIAIPVAWAAVAVVLGLVIGNGIRIERGIEPDQPASRITAGTNMVVASKVGMPATPVAQAENVLVPAPADVVASSADADWPAARGRQASLTGAR
jgi:hypothetical protein